MFAKRIIRTEIVKPNLLWPAGWFSHTAPCPAGKKADDCKVKATECKELLKICKAKEKVVPSAIGDGGGFSKLVRAERSGPVRFGFIPDEWFLFFYPKTGVTGPYFFLLGITNYALSKEIYVMEHEYYSGLSIALLLYLVTTKLGPQIGASLDKEVDAISAEFTQIRTDELNFYENTIKMCEDAMWRARGQKLLIDAKKENVRMQLEAAYRERLFTAYWAVRGRMDYHIKKRAALFRIHQKWMVEWILVQVRRSITPEFKKQALKSAIGELSGISVATY